MSADQKVDKTVGSRVAQMADSSAVRREPSRADYLVEKRVGSWAGPTVVHSAALSVGLKAGDWAG